MTTHTEKDFEQMMNENYELADIAGLKYAAGYALRLVDPILFRQAYLDWLDEAGVAGEFPDIDCDTLPECVKEMGDLHHYSEFRDVVLSESNEWDDTAVVLNDNRVITLVDSSNMDEYEYDEQSGLFVSPYGPEMCSGCVDFYVFKYRPVFQTWEEQENGVYEYYPGDTLQTFLERNQVI